MAHLRKLVAATLALGLLGTPLLAAPAPGTQLGIVVFADHARLGTGSASVGSTVFGGDRLSTESAGSVQVRAGAARLLLSSASAATLSQEDSSPTATLTTGSATFSTANSKAFVVHFSTATIRPNTDEPTVGQVTVVGPREFLVKSTRGALAVSVEGETRVVAEGAAYRVILDPTPAEAAAAASPAAGSPAPSGPPVSAGTSKFVWYAAAAVAVVTILAVHAALESPDRP